MEGKEERHSGPIALPFRFCDFARSSFARQRRRECANGERRLTVAAADEGQLDPV